MLLECVEKYQNVKKAFKKKKTILVGFFLFDTPVSLLEANSFKRWSTVG